MKNVLLRFLAVVSVVSGVVFAEDVLDISRRFPVPFGSATSATFRVQSESIVIQSLQLANVQAAGTGATGVFVLVTAASAGSVTNPVGFPSLSTAGTTNGTNHKAYYFATNTLAGGVVLFFGDALTCNLSGGASNGLFIVTGDAGPAR